MLSSPDPAQARLLLFRVFLIAALAVAGWNVLRMFSPFISALAGAATISLLVHPLHARLLRALKGRASIAAAISTLLIVVGLVLPFLLVAWVLVKEITAQAPLIAQWAGALRDQGPAALEQLLPPRLVELMVRAESMLGGWGVDVRALLVDGMDALGASAAGIGGQVIKGTSVALFNAFIVVVGVFFFLRDGARMIRSIVDMVPMESVHKEQILARLDATFGAVVRGMILTATSQGLLAGVGYLIAGVPHAPVLAMLTAFLALVPLVGAAGIWLPCFLYLLLTGGGWQAWFLLVWGMVVVSGSDNIIKPLLIQGRANIPTFLLIFSILGGLSVYGFLGIFFGPLLVGLLLALMAIYKEQYGAHAHGAAPAPQPVIVIEKDAEPTPS